VTAESAPAITSRWPVDEFAAAHGVQIEELVVDGEPWAMAFHPTPTPCPLTLQQVRVLELVAEGLPNEQVGAQLGITRDTVKAHLRSVLKALGVADRAHAVLVALRAGWVS
jgi:DNA-binding NarL/FixJ family response regulator